MTPIHLEIESTDAECHRRSRCGGDLESPRHSGVITSLRGRLWHEAPHLPMTTDHALRASMASGASGEVLTHNCRFGVVWVAQECRNEDFGNPSKCSCTSTTTRVSGMEMKLNAELIKRLRNEKAWSQDQLADVAGVSLRTIQRIEKNGIASLESKKAIASAFGMQSAELDACENKSDFKGNPDNLYLRVEDGSKLAEVIGGAYAYRLNHDNPENEEEADILASAAQSLQDWGEIWSDLEAGQKVKATFELSQLITELDAYGFWVFALRTFEEHPSIKSKKWPIANVFLMRSNNPKIVKLNLTEKASA